MAYSGARHCGEVTFSCNCSFCRRKGSLLTFVPATQFELTSGEEALKSYFFNKHRIEHRFCTTCGTQPFSAATAPDGRDMRAINLRCVPEAKLEALEIKVHDGASV